MKKTIQIGIPCGTNSELFTKFLIESIEKTASEEHNIELLLGINMYGVDEKFLEEIETKYSKKIFHGGLVHPSYTHTGKVAGGSSIHHGEILNRLFHEMNSEYGMVIDCDTAFLCKDWDKKLVSLLDDKTIIIGTEYGCDDKKFMKNPNAIMSLFLVDKLKETDLSWIPAHEYIQINEQNCKIYNRDIGDEIFLDTASQVPERLHEAGLKGIALPLVSPRIDIGDIKFMKQGMRGEEYQLEGTPILTHLGRALTRGSQEEAVILWKNRVKEWLQNQ